MYLNIKAPGEIALELSQRVKTLRLAKNLTQKGLAARSGVSLGSVKRFELTGQVSLSSLLQIALVLDCLSDFEKIAIDDEIPKSIEELLKEDKLRERGRLND